MLYEVFLKFWEFFFKSETVSAPDQWITLLAMISCIGCVWICMIRPLVKLIKGRN